MNERPFDHGHYTMVVTGKRLECSRQWEGEFEDYAERVPAVLPGIF
jgi:hypothetical protein